MSKYCMHIVLNPNPDLTEINNILSKHNAEIIKKYEALDTWKIEADMMEIQELMDELDICTSIKFAEMELQLKTCIADFVPNANLYIWGQQSAMEVMNVPKAWSITQGDPSIIISNLDTGCDINNPNLAGQIVGSYDMYGSGDNPQVTYDDHFHGTMTSGVLANGPDISGMAHGCKLFPIKVEQTDLGNTDILDGINKAVTLGIPKILSISWAGSLSFALSAPSSSFDSLTQFRATGDYSWLLNYEIYTVKTDQYGAHLTGDGGGVTGVITYANYSTTILNQAGLGITTLIIQWDDPTITTLPQFNLIGINNSGAYSYAITKAWNAGMIVCIAAGNNGAWGKNPVSGKNAILVAASYGPNLFQNYSQYGPWVHFAAESETLRTIAPINAGFDSATAPAGPIYIYVNYTAGSNIATLVSGVDDIGMYIGYPLMATAILNIDTIILPGSLGHNIILSKSASMSSLSNYSSIGFQYMTMWGSGTSFATPNVAAAMGLVWSANLKLNNQQVVNCMAETANPGINASSINFVLNPNGTNINSGKFVKYGLIDVFSAVKQALSYALTEPDLPAGNYIGNKNIQLIPNRKANIYYTIDGSVPLVVAASPPNLIITMGTAEFVVLTSNDMNILINLQPEDLNMLFVDTLILPPSMTTSEMITSWINVDDIPISIILNYVLNPPFIVNDIIANSLIDNIVCIVNHLDNFEDGTMDGWVGQNWVLVTPTSTGTVTGFLPIMGNFAIATLEIFSLTKTILTSAGNFSLYYKSQVAPQNETILLIDGVKVFTFTITMMHQNPPSWNFVSVPISSGNHTITINPGFSFTAIDNISYPAPPPFAISDIISNSSIDNITNLIDEFLLYSGDIISQSLIDGISFVITNGAFLIDDLISNSYIDIFAMTLYGASYDSFEGGALCGWVATGDNNTSTVNGPVNNNAYSGSWSWVLKSNTHYNDPADDGSYLISSAAIMTKTAVNSGTLILWVKSDAGEVRINNILVWTSDDGNTYENYSQQVISGDVITITPGIGDPDDDNPYRTAYVDYCVVP